MDINTWHNKFVSALRQGGVEDGQSILVHSSFKAMLCPGTPDDVVDALLEVVGSCGNLAVPTHTWDIVNARQPVFDVLLTPSHVGAITEFVRRRPEAVRSLHPTHSVTVIGPGAVDLTKNHEHDDTPCSRTSPYGRIVAGDGLIVMLGVSLLYNTTYHGVEEWAGVPWVFRSDYKEDLYTIDKEGNRIHVPSFRHAGQERKFEETQFELEHEGILKVVPWEQKLILVLKAKQMAEYMGQKLADDPDYLLASP